MEWFKKHTDTAIILGAFAAAILWMNGKFNDVERNIGGLKTDIAIVKTVLIMKNIMPADLAKCHDEKKGE
jgi:hypothetical protein